MSEANRPEISDEKIAGLLRLTGPRPAVPEDRARRVKAVVRARWQAGTRARARRLAWAVGALAAAAALAVVVGRAWLSRPALPHAPMARVEAVTGPASIRPAPAAEAVPPQDAGPPVEARTGLEVPPGHWLETGGDGHLALRLPAGASLRLDAGTRVAIDSDRALTLLAGALYVDSRARGGRPAAGSIEVRTPAGRVREIGTQFEVRLVEDALRLRVREGQVAVDRPSGGLEVRSGTEVRVDRDGRTSSRDLSPYDAEWAWVEAIAPMMEIEGRTLGEFLDWMGRERGLAIRFAAPDLEGAAAAIRLNGSIQGMTLDQALESVLLTCRMRHRIEGGALIVEALDDPAL